MPMPQMGMQDEDRMGMAQKPPVDHGDSADDEPVSIFLTKAQLEGRTVKPGDTLTLKVRDVDPESGEVEAVCSYDENEDGKKGYEAAFDEAMPEEEPTPSMS